MIPRPVFTPALLLVSTMLLAVGCGAVPRVATTGARPTARTDEAAQFRIDLRLANEGTEDIPLERFEYVFTVKGVGVFEGRWAALRTIPPGQSITMEIPASIALPPDLAERVDLDAPIQWRLDGGVRYQAPGFLGRILFDVGVRRPTESFRGSGTFTLERAAGSAPPESSDDDATAP
ncbi:MAG: LEA type 2 family protein [Phycisphaeraceae bacterium]|nr:LEA type 2 family protein [Phycisphaeraceae bacterium]MDG1978785.1 LEA type 2 family protein [Phycisphaerales bacterium]